MYHYKYRDWGNKFHRKMLTENEIYFSSAKDLNDPFDSIIPIRYDLLPDDAVIKLYKKLIHRQYPFLSIREVELQAKKEFNKGLYKNPEHLKWFKDFQRQKTENEIGIFSVSKSFDNILLWSHYASSHQGFCVGLDVVKLQKYFETELGHQGTIIYWYDVKYVADFPILIPSVDDTRSEEEMIAPLITKSKHWEYEEEHRYILIGKTNEAITLQDDVIVKVILGSKIPQKHTDEIIKVLSDKATKVELLKAELGNNQYGLKFNRIEY